MWHPAASGSGSGDPDLVKGSDLTGRQALVVVWVPFLSSVSEWDTLPYH